MGVGTLILNRLMAGLQLNTDLGAGGGGWVMEVEVEVDGRRDPPMHRGHLPEPPSPIQPLPSADCALFPQGEAAKKTKKQQQRKICH